MKFKMLLGSWILGMFALSGTAAAEPKESGEKGNTEDINIGLGELQEGKENADGERAAKTHKKKAKRKARKKAAKKKAAAKKMRRKKKTDATATEKEIVRDVDSGDSVKKKKSGNAETTWKVEKGEK